MKRAVLACNGLDKMHGVLARELAIILAETQQAEVICPVLLNNSPARYEKALAASSLLVIDGCATRCATKLATKLGMKIAEKLLVAEQAKVANIEVGSTLRPGTAENQLIQLILGQLTEVKKPQAEAVLSSRFEPPTEFLTVTHDKFVFKIPANGYLFNENDCWVRVIGNRARVGVSDYVQQSLTDITWAQPVDTGTQVEQFDEVGSMESAKSAMDVLSPVAGVVVAINTELAESPELVNEDPYGKGWIAELEIRDLDADREFLLDAALYSKHVVDKAAEAQP